MKRLNRSSLAILQRMNEKAKSIIIGYTPTDQPSKASSSCGFFSNRSPFSKPEVHLHELSAYDYLLAHMHNLDPQEMKNEASEDLEVPSAVAEPFER